MRRRAVLGSAVGVFGGFTGCIGFNQEPSSRANGAQADGAPIPAAELELDEVDDRAIGREFSRPLELYGTTAQAVLTHAIEDGSVFVETETPPFQGTLPIWYDDRIFEIINEVGQTRPATRYFWDLDPIEEVPDSDTVQFDALPEVDKSKFRLHGLEDGSMGERDSRRIGGTFKYANDDRDQSALVPTPTRSVISWGPDRHSRFTISSSNSDGATVTEYRYTATLLAESFSSYGQHVRERYTFELTGLPESEREIVDQAIASRYEIEHGGTVPDSFRSLAERFRSSDAAINKEGGITTEYLVTYGGTLYAVSLVGPSAAGSDPGSTPTPSP